MGARTGIADLAIFLLRRTRARYGKSRIFFSDQHPITFSCRLAALAGKCMVLQISSRDRARRPTMRHARGVTSDNERMSAGKIVPVR
jgi:hypothetical protein